MIGKDGVVEACWVGRTEGCVGGMAEGGFAVVGISKYADDPTVDC